MPHFHEPDPTLFKKRYKRDLPDPDMVHYGISVNNELHHIELWPNRDFVHPHVIIERRDPRAPIDKRNIGGLGNQKMCYYTGKVRGYKSSEAAISTCDGLAGTIRIGNKLYFIEPVQDHTPNADGHHLHVMYENHPEYSKRFCGVNSSPGHWEKSIRERLRQDFTGNKILFKKQATFEVVPQWIQMMIVADKKFILKHKGQRDILQWILTIMNMVKSLYADESMTSFVTPVIVRIILLEKEEDEIDLDITADVDETLKSFCAWALKLQQPNGTAQHFDTSLLLSNWDFCHDNGDCDVQGIGMVGNACGPMPCQLNEDRGFMTGITVSHEQGHLIGMDHDDNPPLCPPNDTTDGMWYVMAPTGEALTVKWSPCSLATMREMARSHFLDCFNDEPPSTDYTIPDKMPGVMSTILEQCEMSVPLFNWTGTCKADSCYPIYCQAPDKCRAFPVEVVDGTPCGNNKWCFRQKCVDKGSRPEAVDGGWGEWTEWGKCSRTCGKGVQHKERFCDSPKPANHGKYCLGPQREYKMCIVEDCPDDAPSFREQQCKEKFDPSVTTKNVTVEEFLYPNIKPETPCLISCVFLHNGQKEIFKVGKADDGTICTPGVPNIICIDGVCKEVGCDGKFGSSAVEDRCGVCNGDGTMCKVVEGTWVAPGELQTYPKIVEIPIGAKKIEVTEVNPSPNIIALGTADASGWYINGNFKLSSPGAVMVGKKHNMYTFYTGHDVPTERLTVDQAKEDLAFYLGMMQGFVANYTYKWIEPTDEPSYEPKYAWDTDEYEDCSALCDGGVQNPKFHCTEEKAGRVSDKYCDKLDKPSQEPRKCNEKPCAKEWKVGIWGRCRACKKKGGVRVRPVECVKKNPKPGGDDIIQEDAECPAPKPGRVELCETLKTCGSRRKRTYHIPGEYQDIVWQQMKRLHLIKREVPSTFATAERTFPPRRCPTGTVSTTRPTPAIFTGTVNLPKKDQVIVDKGPGLQMIEIEQNLKDTGNLSEQDMKMGVQPGTKMVMGTTAIITGKILWIK